MRHTLEARRESAAEILERAERVREDALCRASDARQTVNDLRERLRRDLALSPRQRAQLSADLRRAQNDLSSALHEALAARQQRQRAAHQLVREN